MSKKFHVKQDRPMSSNGMRNGDPTHAREGIATLVEMLENRRF